MFTVLHILHARLRDLVEAACRHPSAKEIEMDLILDELIALGNELAQIEAALTSGGTSDVSTAVSTAVSTTQAADELSASTALSSALADAEASTSAAVVSAISQTQADDQAQVAPVVSSLTAQVSQMAVTAGVSSSLAPPPPVPEPAPEPTPEPAPEPAALSVSPNPVSVPAGASDTVELTISGGTPPYGVDGLGNGQSFDPATNSLNFDGSALAGSGDATVVDSSSPPLTTPITISIG